MLMQSVCPSYLIKDTHKIKLSKYRIGGIVLKKALVIFMVFFILFQSKMYAYSARSYCVIDALTGRVLYGSNEDLKHGMASTTKIMTAIVALETANKDEIATVSYNASRTEGSSLYLKAGEKMSIENLVYGLMLNSGNDAAVVIAEHIGGSVEEFARMMNDMAKKIGANSTNFTNPNGLYDENHYTTAYDLALITRYALKNEQFQNIVSTKKYTAETTDGRKIYLSNHNKLLGMLEGCDGVKTGFTKKTGRCLVSSASQNGWQVICVTLDASDDWNDHISLINKAFSEYKLTKILSKGRYLKTIAVNNGEQAYAGAAANCDIYVPLKENESFDFEINTSGDDTAMAPVYIGQQAGKAQIMYNSEVIGEVGLEFCSNVEEAKIVTYFDCLKKVLEMFCF